MRVTVRLAVLSAAVTAWGAACSSGVHVSSNGPLDASGDPSTQCVPQPTSQPLTFGLNTATNTSKADVRIREVKLVKPVAIEVLEARVFLLSSTASGPAELVGMWPTYPPNAAQLAASEIVWSSVHVANNFVIHPGATANLVLELSRTRDGTAGTASATEIHYSSEGRNYETTTNTAIRLAPSASC